MFTWTDNDCGTTEGHIMFSHVSYFERYTFKQRDAVVRVFIDSSDEPLTFPDSEYMRFVEELKAWVEK